MVPYIFIFSLSFFFSILSENAYKHKNKAVSILLGIFVVVSVSMFAGIRDYNVGTDVHIYILPYYNRALLNSLNFKTYVKDISGVTEIGFLFVEYIAANVFHNPHFAMFAIALLTNGFIYLGITKQRGKMSIPLGWLTYCLVFFNFTFNIMRQMLSIAILFYLFSNLSKLSWHRVILFTLSASLMHRSALIGLFFYAAFLLICRRREVFGIHGIRRIYSMIFLLFPVLLPIVMRVLIQSGLFNQRYLLYLDDFSGERFLWGNFIFRVLCFFPFAYSYYRKYRGIRCNSEQSHYLLYIGIMDILLILNSSLMFSRVRLYFDFYLVEYLPMGLHDHLVKGKQRLIIIAIAVLCLAFYWYYLYIFLGNGETYPYKIDPNWMRGLR